MNNIVIIINKKIRIEMLSNKIIITIIVIKMIMIVTIITNKTYSNMGKVFNLQTNKLKLITKAFTIQILIVKPMLVYSNNNFNKEINDINYINIK